jgi:hypothetical protein
LEGLQQAPQNPRRPTEWAEGRRYRYENCIQAGWSLTLAIACLVAIGAVATIVDARRA